MDIFEKRTPHLDAMELADLKTSRAAGILLHISSLPSRFGVGDMGPEASKFADFLNKGKQKYWQLLPLNPVSVSATPSPYTSISSMAGNTIYISPELLVEDGLISEDELTQHELPQTDKADFLEADRVKNILFDIAYNNFKANAGSKLLPAYKEFCKQEAYWLNDYALYLALKNEHGYAAWFQWPESYKQRDPSSLTAFSVTHAEALDKIKWLQFIFDKQWKSLKKYCNELAVQMFGDIAFYVGYDSSDVWSNPDIFSLDEEGNISGIAGVPPDYFNSDGQLWGMPVFRWDVLKNTKYDWWMKRINRNLELFDEVRLDHFRAFADYWEVPGNHHNAINGTWKEGPGLDFFKVVEKKFGRLPFIIEDLGEITQAVCDLRDDLGFPGMKILQFAFGQDMATSVHIPHNYTPNYVVYTGTHDNNTTVGWLRQNTGDAETKNLLRYIGGRPSQRNIHLLLGRLAYSSTARIVILPAQDVLGLDESARMNTPGTMDNNWVWRLLPGQLRSAEVMLLRKWTELYNR